MSIKISKGFFKAVEKSWNKEFNKYKRKLNKKQLKKLDRYQQKQADDLNVMIKTFGPMIEATQKIKMKLHKKNDSFIKYLCVPYIKHTLLKIEKPKLPKYTGPGPDPYTCGPEYFRSSCHCCYPSHYWENDRR